MWSFEGGVSYERGTPVQERVAEMKRQVAYNSEKVSPSTLNPKS